MKCSLSAVHPFVNCKLMIIVTVPHKFMNKKDTTALLIDIAIPRDDNIVDKRIEKVEKYQNLAIDFKALWQLKEIAIVPIIVGCTGVVDKTFVK